MNFWKYVSLTVRLRVNCWIIIFSSNLSITVSGIYTTLGDTWSDIKNSRVMTCKYISDIVANCYSTDVNSSITCNSVSVSHDSLIPVFLRSMFIVIIFYNYTAVHFACSMFLLIFFIYVNRLWRSDFIQKLILKFLKLDNDFQHPLLARVRVISWYYG